MPHMPQSTLRDTLPSDMSRDIVHHASHRGRSNTQIARTDNNCTQGAQDSSSCLVTCASVPLSSGSCQACGAPSAPKSEISEFGWAYERDAAALCACDRCERSAQSGFVPTYATERPLDERVLAQSPRKIDRATPAAQPEAGRSLRPRSRPPLHPLPEGLRDLMKVLQT